MNNQNGQQPDKPAETPNITQVSQQPQAPVQQAVDTVKIACILS